MGGLSVLRALRERLPSESFLYLGDSSFCPYGDKDDETIHRRVHALIAELFQVPCKAVVIACNTACAVALPSLRREHPYPIIGLEPAVKPAVRRSKSKRIAVLATPRTARGDALGRLIATHSNGAVVETVPAPGLVDLIESGGLRSRRMRSRLSELLEGPLARGCDTIVLGCTHYPFLAGEIAEIAGPAVAIVSSGKAVARQTAAVLERAELLAPATSVGTCAYWTTGDPVQFGRIATELLGVPVRAEHVPAGALASA